MWSIPEMEWIQVRTFRTSNSISRTKTISTTTELWLCIQMGLPARTMCSQLQISQGILSQVSQQVSVSLALWLHLQPIHEPSVQTKQIQVPCIPRRLDHPWMDKSDQDPCNLQCNLQRTHPTSWTRISQHVLISQQRQDKTTRMAESSLYFRDGESNGTIRERLCTQQMVA